MRNSWGENHMQYIGRGPTTLEAVGAGYADLRARLARADGRMQNANRNFSEIMARSPRRVEEAQARFAGDGAGPSPAPPRSPYADSARFRAAQDLNQRMASDRRELLRKDMPGREARRELQSQQRQQTELTATLSTVRVAEQTRYRQILQEQVDMKGTARMQGTMTQEEKKMNKADLRSYKDYEHSLSAMVCGLQNSPVPRRNGTIE